MNKGNGGPPEEGNLFDDWMKISHPPERLKNVSVSIQFFIHTTVCSFWAWKFNVPEILWME